MTTFDVLGIVKWTAGYRGVGKQTHLRYLWVSLSSVSTHQSSYSCRHIDRTVLYALV